MNRYTIKMLLRSIRSTLGRFLAIMAIIALGVGFFAGLKSSQPAMISTADVYMSEQSMYDFQLISTLGLTDEDLSAFRRLEGVEGADGAFSVDALAAENGGQEAYKFMSITGQVCVPSLTEGRMPENDGECLADSMVFSAADIGRTVTISGENDEDTLDGFTRTSFTIVGLAKTPRYISADRGSSSLGSGSIKGFILLLDGAFASEVYHEILLCCGLPGEIYSEEYDAARDRIEPSVKRLLNKCGAQRYRTLRAEADAELDDAQKEIDDGWADYETGAADAQAKLNDSYNKLTDSQRELDDALAKIEDGEKQLDDAEAKIPAGLAEIEKNRALLDEKAQTLASGKAQLEAGYAQLAEQENKLNAGRVQLAALKALTLAPYQAAVDRINGEISATQAAIDVAQSLPFVDEALVAALTERLAQQQQRLGEAQASLDAKSAEFASQEAEIAAGEQQLAAARAELDAKSAELAAGEQAIADGRAQLDAKEKELKDAQASLPEKRAQLKEARAQLEDGAKELKDGWAQYNAGKAEAEQELADARQKLLDAETELADARAETDDRLKLDLYTLDRESNSGYVTFENDTNIIDGVANAFPVFFALIAALVCVTTMTRMINEERTQIGTLKAMGYSDGAIMGKYLLYSGLSASIGCVAGFFLGTTAIPHIVWMAYNIIYDYARLDFFFSPLMYGASLGAAVLGTVLVTWLACRRELAERPAELIRPKAPAVGRRILLERVRPLWKRLSFLSKVTVRNAFRYRQRVAMMLIGIGGCTALIVTGFGAKDSIANVLDYQYEEISLYDVSVTLDTEEFASDAAAAKLWQGSADSFAMTWQDSITLSAGGKDKSTKLVAASEEQLDGIISLHDKNGELPFPGEGEAVITEKLSELLNIGRGDEAVITLDDGETVTVTVTGVCDNYLNHFVYVCPETVGSPQNNTALLRADEGVDAEQLAAHLRAEEGVSYVSSAGQERETMSKSMASLDTVVVLLIVCSGALAVITLYNLTNINIMERIREIATVKVLGFFPNETAAYILRENLMLSALGAALGLLLGKLLHRFVMQMIQVEYMTYDVRIAPLSYFIGFAATMLFAFITNYIMRFKLERVNMAESLKSVE